MLLNMLLEATVFGTDITVACVSVRQEVAAGQAMPQAVFEGRLVSEVSMLW